MHVGVRTCFAIVFLTRQDKIKLERKVQDHYPLRVFLWGQIISVTPVWLCPCVGSKMESKGKTLQILDMWLKIKASPLLFDPPYQHIEVNNIFLKFYILICIHLFNFGIERIAMYSSAFTSNPQISIFLPPADMTPYFSISFPMCK